MIAPTADKLRSPGISTGPRSTLLYRQGPKAHALPYLFRGESRSGLLSGGYMAMAHRCCTTSPSPTPGIDATATGWPATQSPVSPQFSNRDMQTFQQQTGKQVHIQAVSLCTHLLQLQGERAWSELVPSGRFARQEEAPRAVNQSSYKSIVLSDRHQPQRPHLRYTALP